MPDDPTEIVAIDGYRLPPAGSEILKASSSVFLAHDVVQAEASTKNDSRHQSGCDGVPKR